MDTVARAVTLISHVLGRCKVAVLPCPQSGPPNVMRARFSRLPLRSHSPRIGYDGIEE